MDSGKHSIQSRDKLDTIQCGLTQFYTQLVHRVCTACVTGNTVTRRQELEGAAAGAPSSCSSTNLQLKHADVHAILPHEHSRKPCLCFVRETLGDRHSLAAKDAEMVSQVRNVSDR
jgi:hypothetical protein